LPGTTNSGFGCAPIPWRWIDLRGDKLVPVIAQLLGASTDDANADLGSAMPFPLRESWPAPTVEVPGGMQ
jgi:hypothetical protein